MPTPTDDPSEAAVDVLRGVTRWRVGDIEPVEMVAARSTQEAVVVPVEGHPHAPQHAR